MDAHNERVATVAAKVRDFYKQQKPFRLYHGSTNSTRGSQRNANNIVDTSQLSNILRIDTASGIALVEPNSPMDRLVEATLKYGLIPPVVMEFPGITVGGGFAGTAGESSSYKYGFFDRTINKIEMILANGEIVTASAEERADLFYGAASSFGTLGITTLLELQLIPAREYVELTYIPVDNINAAIEKITEFSKVEGTDYIDGIMFSQTSGLICAGRLVGHPAPGNKIQQFRGAKDPWFYTHAKSILSQHPSSPYTEAVPIVDYFFRYDRGAFWVGRYTFMYLLTPFNRFTRWLYDGFMHTRELYHMMHASGHHTKALIQDVAIPYSKAEEFLAYLDEQWGFYPIWLCPLRLSGMNKDAPHGMVARKAKNKCDGEEDMLMNFGVWGPGKADWSEHVALNRSIEHKVQSLGGQKWLYAHTYYTKEEFEEIYDMEGQERLRSKYHAGYLPSLYDKVKVNWQDGEGGKGKRTWREKIKQGVWNTWPFGGIYGVLKAKRGGDYLLSRERKGKGKDV